MIIKSELMFTQITKKYLREDISTEVRLVLKSAIMKIYNGFNIPIRPQTTEELINQGEKPFSKVIWSKETKKPIVIVLNISAQDETIIWDLLHEFGHLQDGSPTDVLGNRERDFVREKRAWDIGRAELQAYPEFLDSYNKRAEGCLASYLK